MESTKPNTKEWQQTLDALESVAKGKVIAAKEVHEWLNSWRTGNELKAPTFKKDDVRTTIQR
jgi:predicted transcriptional regulator